jgi:hypothetical protein
VSRRVGYWGEASMPDMLRAIADHDAPRRTFLLRVASDIETLLAENATLKAEWEHVARHLADICDAWDDRDSIEEIGKHVHQASAYLLAAGERKPNSTASLT